MPAWVSDCASSTRSGSSVAAKDGKSRARSRFARAVESITLRTSQRADSAAQYAGKRSEFVQILQNLRYGWSCATGFLKLTNLVLPFWTSAAPNTEVSSVICPLSMPAGATDHEESVQAMGRDKAVRTTMRAGKRGVGPTTPSFGLLIRLLGKQPTDHADVRS
jgi:hypothetical protein